jgi:hypothetical protein
MFSATQITDREMALEAAVQRLREERDAARYELDFARRTVAELMAGRDSPVHAFELGKAPA